MKPPFFIRFSVQRRLFFLLLLVAGLTACQTPPPSQGLTAKQIDAIKHIGFSPVEVGWELNLGERILFDTGIDTPTAEGKSKIARIATTLKEIGIEQLIVEGHTDNVGNEKFNYNLSLRRAQAIAAILVENGFSEKEISQRGFGSKRPVDDNKTVKGRMQNRRVSIIIPVE